MKPAISPLKDRPLRVEYRVQFSTRPKASKRTETARTIRPLHTAEVQQPATTGVPKVARLLVLGHRFERLVGDGVVKDYAEIARITGLTRARITQIANLLLLAPDIQEEILNLPRDTQISERHLRPIVAHPDWRSQREMVRSLMPCRQPLG